MKPIRKAVFPVAGLGTRFLPATKASPKEMLPVVDKPLIQYAVEEALEAGVTELIFVTGRGKRAIEDHFDRAAELEMELEKKGKTEMLERVRHILPRGVTCLYIRQAEALGLGHAVLCAKSVIGDEPFAVLLADDLLDASPSVLKQMTDVFAAQGAPVLAAQNVPLQDIGSYGIIETVSGNIFEEGKAAAVQRIVEKPKPEETSSTLAVIGRYVLTPRIFHHLENVGFGAGGEIQLTDAIAALLREETVLAYRYRGDRYDCGSKLGYLRASVVFGQRHPEVGAEFSEYLAHRSSGESS
ncbi:MAG: UTP--glucose-1-phosphate uridylyltransferase GalU [Zoogloeaceae bacterium]|jgi:UTP--glucose-1-phosphate uridylyltransferase|nr:UTP--glucose-1-phosphate uridylyltransferase GalU [Zoogloeaceae bacterium]